MTESKVAKYLNKLKEFSNNSSNLIFRGVPDSTWNIQSSAARRLIGKNNQFEFIQYHTNLIEDVRNNHFFESKHDLENGHDLEILAQIQHQGGATCLTDFTTNFLIALWFASVNTKDTININGKIFIIDKNCQENEDKLYTYKIKKYENEPIDKILTKPRKYIDFKRNTDPRFWIWEPTLLNNRIIKQDSVFVFGLPVVDKNTLSTLQPILIESEDKDQIIKELDMFFHISAETIFHDFAGFSTIANHEKAPINNRILQNQPCYKNGKAYFKMEEYDMAEKFFLNAINCHGEEKCNKTDNRCNETDKRELFYWKGLCNMQYENGISSKALIDFNDSIKADSNNDSFLKGAYRKKLSLLYDMKMFDEAISLSEGFLVLYPQPENYDFYFAILELSLMLGQRTYYEKYYSKIKSDELLMIGNKKVLLYYFSSISEIVFKDRESVEIDKIVEKFFAYLSDVENQQKKEKQINLENTLEQFTWNYTDILSWIEKLSEKKHFGILMMTQRLQNMHERLQTKLLYKVGFTPETDNLVLITKTKYPN